MSTDNPAETAPQSQPPQATPDEGPQSVKGARINKGLVIVNTGSGKGKITSCAARSNTGENNK